MNFRMATNNDKPLRFISYLQIIAILLVVAGHSVHEYPDGCNGNSTLFYRMVYSFHIPLFVFISGFLLDYTLTIRRDISGRNGFISGKIRRLIIPFVTLTLVTFIPRSLLSGMADDGITLSWQSLAEGLLHGGRLVIPFFWFLQTIFTLLTVTYLILIAASRVGIKGWITYLLITTLYGALPYIIDYSPWFSIGETCRLAIFFAVGMIFSASRKKLEHIVNPTSLLTLTVCAALWVSTFFVFEGTEIMPVCSLCGIAMCISFARILASRNITMLDRLTGSSYMIFLLSWYFNVGCQQVLSHFTDFPWWVYTMLSFSFGILVPYMIFRYMDNHPDGIAARFGQNFLGQKFRKIRK